MRDSAKAKEWRGQVLQRDNYECQLCGSKEYLIAHHKKNWWHSIKDRYNVANGITLCASCHSKQEKQRHLQFSPDGVDKTGRRFWIKIWTEEWLDGSIREQLTATERSIWVDLLVMAGRSRNAGIIQSNPDTPYSHDYLANRFKVSKAELSMALKHFEEQERIHENEKGIEIINWHKYQDPKKRVDEVKENTRTDKAGMPF